LDIQRRVLQGDRGSLMDRIPGYRGYKDKELRREADKLLRTRIADAVASEVRQLNALKLELTNRGQLMLLSDFERATTKLQRFADQVRTASYGYAGLFDAVRVEEPELNALYDFDLALEAGTERLAQQRAALAAAIDKGEGVREAIRALAQLGDDFNAQFERRRQVILEGKPSPGPNPLDVLAPPEKMHPKAQQLINLRLGDAVSYAGKDYTVDGRVVFSGRDRPTVNYLLGGGDAETWLLAGEGGNRLAVLHPHTAPEGALGDTLTLEGESFRAAGAGSASVQVEVQSGRRGGQNVGWRQFETEGGRLLWVEDWADGRRAFLGERVTPEELELWTKAR
jgi:hypothetical protein